MVPVLQKPASSPRAWPGTSAASQRPIVHSEQHEGRGGYGGAGGGCPACWGKGALNESLAPPQQVSLHKDGDCTRCQKSGLSKLALWAKNSIRFKLRAAQVPKYAARAPWEKEDYPFLGRQIRKEPAPTLFMKAEPRSSFQVCSESPLASSFHPASPGRSRLRLHQFSQREQNRPTPHTSLFWNENSWKWSALGRGRGIGAEGGRRLLSIFTFLCSFFTMCADESHFYNVRAN